MVLNHSPKRHYNCRHKKVHTATISGAYQKWQEQRECLGPKTGATIKTFSEDHAMKESCINKINPNMYNRSIEKILAILDS